MIETIVIQGPGRMGLALGAALRRSGEVQRVLFQGRSMDPPPHPIFERSPSGAPGAEYRAGVLPPPGDAVALIIAVPDSALGEVAWDLANSGPPPPGCSALHLSGALSTDVLSPLHAAGYSVGSLHPMQTVADPWLSADRLTGIAFAIAGEPAAARVAHQLVNALNGMPLVIAATQRPVYHAAAVTASNYLVAVLASASRLLHAAGVPADQTLPALLPLVRGTLDNLEQLGVPAALTGPIARGDMDTVRLHLARLSPDDHTLYCALGREVLRLARQAGLDGQKADEMANLLGSG
ncbi:MAG TPA: Rossmann-like and DUF2520 domain-containing protein [Longimicrobiales bacterium]|nr:Rossmann-like and DUF2520 domain-containing protein [Longimicrobiales bacterium]